MKTVAASGCLLALAAGLLLISCVRDNLLERLAPFDIPVLWLSTRLLPFVLVYIVAGHAAQSDVSTCYWPQAVGAASGHVPYRDFESFFGPLFPYLLAAPLPLWMDARVLILWMSVLEAVTVFSTLRISELNRPGRRRARFLLCCFLAPGPLLLTIVAGQEDFLLWLAGLLTWTLAVRGRDIAAGTVALAGLLFTKALFLLPLAGFLGFAGSRKRFLSVLLPAGIFGAILLWLLTGPEFMAVLGQSHNISPPQIWILLHAATGGIVPAGGRAISFTVMLVFLCLAFVTGAKRTMVLHQSFAAFAAYWVVLFGVTMILSPKSQGAYFGIFSLPALVLVLDRPAALVVWVFLGTLAPIVPSIFYRLGEPLSASLDGIPGLLGWVDLLLQTCMVVAIFFLAWQAWRIGQESEARLGTTPSPVIG